MSKREFIKQNRDEIIALLRRNWSAKGLREPITNRDIEEWLANDEALYRWARACGVRV